MQVSLRLLDEDQVHTWLGRLRPKCFVKPGELQQDEDQVARSQPVVGLRQSDAAVPCVTDLGEVGQQFAHIKDGLRIQLLSTKPGVTEALQGRHQAFELAAEVRIDLRLDILDSAFQRFGDLFVGGIRCRR